MSSSSSSNSVLPARRVSLLFLLGVSLGFLTPPTGSLGYSPSSFHQSTTPPAYVTSRRNLLLTTTTTLLPWVTLLAPDAHAASASASLPPLHVPAPPFDLPNSLGTGTTSLESLTQSGRLWTVLYFYPGAFTSGCTLEARGFQRDLPLYQTRHAQIVGVSVDPVEKNAHFCQAEHLDFYMLTDAQGKVSQRYGTALSVPGFGTFSNRQTYLIDPRGYLRWVFTDVESHVARHSAEVLDKLDELALEDGDSRARNNSS